VIKLGSKFTNIQLLEKDIIEVGAATLDRKVSDFAKNNNISNMEFLSCIPGSIGGAITMNSGCYNSDISKILVSIKVIDDKGNEKEITTDKIKFYYRGTNLPENYIILSAKLKGNISSKELIEKRQVELIRKKKESQPSQIKTGGSTFKNENNKKAWVLIKESGCDKFYVGDAKISEKHCNFFVNNGKAKTSDVEELINKVKKEVKSKTGIDLKLEIKIIGDEK
jgi:UDP-N-acetylmuramate dehydrogenase